LESPWHRDEISLLVHLVWHWFRERHDFYAGGNMFIYWDQNTPAKSAGPDFFFVRGVERDRPRRIWAVWQEQNRFPDTIIELLSPTTEHKDRRTNKTLYERTFRTPEYFLYDPVTQQLAGWRLQEGVYLPLMPNEMGWLWSEELGLWLGKWEGEFTSAVSGTWLRFYDARRELVPTPAETERRETETERERADRASDRADRESDRADRECHRADRECHRADTERQRAEQELRAKERERQRAAAAEAEVARLRKLLEDQRPPGDSDE
jgi:Uma2 family endonuclease